MFQKILIKSGSNRNEKGLCIPNLVDMMFYYKEVHVIVSDFELKQLLDAFGEDVLYGLITNHLLILHPCDQHTGAMRIPEGNYLVDTFHHQDIDSIDSLLYQYHRQIVHDSTKNMEFTNKFSKVLELYQYPKLLTESIICDISDDSKFANLTKSFLLQYYPNYSDIENVEIHAEPIDTLLKSVFRFESNLDLDELNKIHKKNGYEKEFSYDTILIAIGETAQDCYLTAELQSEMITNQRWSEMYKFRMNQVINQSVQSQDKIDRFQKAIAVKFFSPGVAFVSGVFTAREVLEVLTLKDSAKFKEWLSKLPVDTELSNEISEAYKESYKQKWPIKVGRSLVQIVAGLIPGVGMILGPGATILDSLIGDRIGKGWNPTMFVNKVLNDKRLKK